MRKIRFFIAIIAAKIICLIGKPFGKSTNLPGEVMLKICPDALALFKLPKTVICVTGTNGKTGTSNLLTHILRSSGKSVVNNSKGSNMAPGLASALAADSTFSGRIKSDIAVLEVDERSSQFIYTKFKPTYILCTNLFRDSIMRNGHSEFIFNKINDYLGPETTLILNGNDGISGMLGENVCKRIYYSVAKTQRSTDICEDTVCDLIACPKCHKNLTYDFYHYNHIGKFHCDNCGFKLPDSKYIAGNVDFNSGCFTFNEEGNGVGQIPFMKENFFNVFNLTGACSVLREMGLDIDTIAAAIDDLSSKTGRFQSESYGGIEITSMLSKNQNPISCSQSLKYLNSADTDTDVVLLITDSNDKVHGHEDISWLYDTDFAPLKDEKIKNIYRGGSRCYDLAQCLDIKGIRADKLRLFENYDALAESLCKEASPDRKVVIYFELYATSVVKMIKAKMGERGDK